MAGSRWPPAAAAGGGDGESGPAPAEPACSGCPATSEEKACVPVDETDAAVTSPVTAAADLDGVQPPSGSLQAENLWPLSPQLAQTWERVQAVPSFSLPVQPFLELNL